MKNPRWIAGTVAYAALVCTLTTLLCHVILDQHPWLPGVIFSTVFSTAFMRGVPALAERNRIKRQKRFREEYLRILAREIPNMRPTEDKVEDQ